MISGPIRGHVGLRQHSCIGFMPAERFEYLRVSIMSVAWVICSARTKSSMDWLLCSLVFSSNILGRADHGRITSKSGTEGQNPLLCGKDIHREESLSRQDISNNLRRLQLRNCHDFTHFIACNFAECHLSVMTASLTSHPQGPQSYPQSTGSSLSSSLSPAG